MKYIILFLIYFEIYFKLFLSLLSKFTPILLILFILYNIDYSIVYCEGDLDNFDKLSQEENNSKSNSKFISPFIKIEKYFKKGIKKITVKIYELDRRLEEWHIKENKKYEERWKIYEENRKRRFIARAIRNENKYANRYYNYNKRK